MSYTKIDFDADYKVGVEIRLGGVDKAKNHPNLNVGEEAWRLYEKTRTAPLGLQVFGRHRKNEAELPGEPGIDLFGEVFPKIAKKRLFGMWNGRESKKERDARVEKAGFNDQLVHPTHKRDISPMEFNFGITSDLSTGSILMMGQAWNLTVNDAWLLGGVHAHQPFYLAFKKSYSNVFADNLKHTLTITGRELLGLLLSGYQLKSGGDTLGDVMVCKDSTKADAMTLIKYAVAAQVFEKPLMGKEAIINPYKDPNTRKLIPQDLVDDIERAIQEVTELKGQYVQIARAAKFNLAIA